MNRRTFCAAMSASRVTTCGFCRHESGVNATSLTCQIAWLEAYIVVSIAGLSCLASPAAMMPRHTTATRATWQCVGCPKLQTLNGTEPRSLGSKTLKPYSRNLNLEQTPNPTNPKPRKSEILSPYKLLHDP